MSGAPVVIATNGFGMAVRPVDSGAPVLTVAANGFGTPIAISDLGTPFVVEGGGGGASAPLLVAPRIGMIGPSTVEYNQYGVNDGAGIRMGNAASGPLTWSLMEARTGLMYMEASAAAPYFTGDNRGVGGAGLAAYPAQIAALAARMAGVPVENRVVIYDPGRNDIQTGMTVADFKTGVLRDIEDMKARGFAKIFLSNLWKKPVSYGGTWVSGGAARLAVDEINSWMLTLLDDTVKLIDFTSTLTNFANADEDPFPNVVRAIDKTHLTNLGGRLAGKAVTAALAPYIAVQSYPTTPVENLIAPFSGSGGAKSGTGNTASVADGWTAAWSGAVGTVTGSVVTVDGKPYQRLTIDDTASIPASGANLTLSLTNSLTLADGAKTGMRFRAKIPATAVPYMLFAQLGGVAQGVSPHRRSGLIVGIADITANTAVGGAGTNFQNAVKFDGSEDLDLWLETPSYVLTSGATLTLSVSLVVTVAGGAALFQIDVGEFQTFNWPL